MEQLYIIIFSFLVFLFISTSFHLLGGIIMCKAYKIELDEISMFYGKALFKLKVKNYAITIGWIPMGGSIKYRNIDDVLSRSKLTRIILNLSGPFTVALITAIILGPTNTLAEIGKGFDQIVRGALAPFEVGEVLVATFFTKLLPQSFLVAYAILATKITAGNLFIIPPVCGGNILLELFLNPQNLKLKIIFTNIGLIIWLIIIVPWALAIGSFIYHIV